jgi:hypothetical protein
MSTTSSRRRNTLLVVLALVIALAGALVCTCKKETKLPERAAAGPSEVASGSGSGPSEPSPSPPPSQPSSTGSGSANGGPSGAEEPLPIDPAMDMPEQSLSTDATLSTGKPAVAIIDGRSDIYSSSLATANPDRRGVLPAKVTLAATTGTIVFPSVVGKSGCAREANYPADGGDCVGGDTAIEAAGGISGVIAHDRSLFLVGVFLAGKPPPAAQPSLDFTKGIAFPELAPALGQVFFIGDGRTGAGSGAEQRFIVPAGASHLYLGFADADSFQGTPGEYGDNSGGLRVTLVQRTP